MLQINFKNSEIFISYYSFNKGRLIQVYTNMKKYKQIFLHTKICKYILTNKYILKNLINKELQITVH